MANNGTPHGNVAHQKRLAEVVKIQELIGTRPKTNDELMVIPLIHLRKIRIAIEKRIEGAAFEQSMREFAGGGR